MGAVLPTAAFAVYFSTQAMSASPLALACRAWLNVATSTRFSGDPVQTGFLGFDHPWRHLLTHAGATLLVLGLVAVIAVGARLVDGAKTLGTRWLVLVGWMAGLTALAWWVVPWNSAGRCLLGFALVYAGACIFALRRPAGTGVSGTVPVLRLLLAVLAAALMLRMLLNGRIHQFGFYQAALAALLVPAVVIGELPARLGVGRWGRIAAATSCLALVAPGVAILAWWSAQLGSLKTQPVAEGNDRFLAFDPAADPTGKLVGQASAWRRVAAAGRPQTLLVLPEGEMINYLAGMPSPVAPFFFYSAATRGGREAEIVGQLDRNPPDWIVLVSRDLREYGVQRYGESPEQGGQIMDWAGDRYEVATAFGGDPLDYHQRGLMILRRRR